MSKVHARLYLIILRCCLFFVVCGLPLALSENYRYGEPPDPLSWEDYGLALLMASPLLLGALALSGRGLVAHFVRALSSVALAVTASGAMFITFHVFSWLAGSAPKDLGSIIVSLVFAALPVLLLIAFMILGAEEVKALVGSEE